MTTELALIKEQALKEIKEEDFRQAVEKYKKQLREKRSILDRILPFKIVILRKEKPCLT